MDATAAARRPWAEIDTMTHDTWLATHSYLQPLALLHAQVNGALEEILTVSNCLPAWAGYADDFHAGVPLLQSPRSGIDFKPAETIITLLLERLASTQLPRPLAEQISTLDAEMRQHPATPRRVVAGLLHEASLTSSYPGLLRYLGWLVLSRHLHPVTEAFDRCRMEDHWLRSYCPACGSLPAMAQLAGTGPLRRRLLACGLCNTRWGYQRMGCPFCETQDHHRLAVLAIEGEAGLRIDYCESCHGYLKTYAGEGNESLLLADWTSIHLDLVAQDRGLKRLAASLFEL
jgi:FdhE protein